jgi:hypothetical protein
MEGLSARKTKLPTEYFLESNRVRDFLIFSANSGAIFFLPG